MSRVLKFRAFYKEYGDPEKPHGSMFYDVMPCAADFSEWLISFGCDGTYDGNFKVGEDIEPMQFTGLTDKNGKEIYEGDIIKDPSGVAGTRAVEMLELCWNFSRPNEWEVVGNVYENPELLTK